MVAWARNERPDVRNLGELGGRLQDSAQRDALAALQRARYAGAPVQGVGSQLERAFKGGIGWHDAAGPPKKNESVLPALYGE